MKIDTDLINRLVQESFGIGFRGDYNGLEKKIFSNINNDSLNHIARNLFKINGVLGFFEYAGFFKSKDGSSLVLRSKYKKAGEKYKTLYSRLLKKEVDIVYME